MRVFDTVDLKKDAFPDMSKEFENRVEHTLESLPEKKGDRIMENRVSRCSFRRVAVIAAAAVMVFGTTVFAAGKVSWYVSSGSAKPVYKELPDAEQIQQDYGVQPLLIEEFSNGYKFEAAYSSNTKAQDEQLNTVEKFTDLDFEYIKEGDVVELNVNTSREVASEDLSLCEKTQINGVDLYYYTCLNKFVPEDYELTDEDKEAEASGEMVFSYGTDGVSVQKNQSIYFQKDGINYLLFYAGEELVKENLLSMADELLAME